MKILGVDYGRKNIGLAVGDPESKFAEPLSVLKFEKVEKVVAKIKQLAAIEKVEKVVVGISEGKMAEEAKEFGEKLRTELRTPVVFQDETLTTHDAQELSIAAQIKRTKRKKMEDAYSAAIILQQLLEN